MNFKSRLLILDESIVNKMITKYLSANYVLNSLTLTLRHFVDDRRVKIK